MLDASTGRVLGTLGGLQGAHGQTVAASGQIYADSGQTGQISIFDPHSLAVLKVVAAGTGADGVIYEPVHNLVVVLDGDGEAVTLIDSDKQTVKAVVKLGGKPEFAVADGTGRIYVNIASTSEIAQLDAGTGKITARFPVPGCVSPHGLTMDQKTRRIFTTCINAKLLVVDADSGRVLQTLPIGHGSDAAAFDRGRHEVFSSNNDGTLSMFQEQPGGALSAMGDVRTAIGARTMAVDPHDGRVFLVTADVDSKLPAAHGSLVTRYKFKPGTVKLLFLDPGRK